MVASRPNSLVKRAWVAKKLVVVAFVVVELIAERLMRVVEANWVSTAKTDEEAAFKMLKARPLIGVWMVVVAP